MLTVFTRFFGGLRAEQTFHKVGLCLEGRKRGNSTGFALSQIFQP
jgi:hypothetical protein